MFGWISRCWGGMGVHSQFERARIRSVIPDWQIPDDNDICILINSFKGVNPELQKETAFNSFFSHLQTSDQKSNPLFLLKHLYILDQTVEQGVALQTISTYYSSEFFIFKHGSNIEFNPLKQLVATYFLYIKKKAQIYNQFVPQYYSIRKPDRQKIINDLSFSQIFELVDKNLNIQKAIDEMNSKYKNHNKTSELIQVIFTMLLKSYLFCYSLISICTKTLFGRLHKMNKVQAVQFFKFIRFYNKDYTRHLYDFIQSNKDIYQFKNMKYSQIITIDSSYIEYLENYIYKLSKQPEQLKGPDSINFEEENNLRALPSTIKLQTQNLMVISHKQRKLYKLASQFPSLQAEFTQYQNFYNQAFESQLQTSKRQQYNQCQQNNPRIDIDTHSMQSAKMLSTNKRIEFQSRISSYQFNQGIWNTWVNIYGS